MKMLPCGMDMMIWSPIPIASTCVRKPNPMSHTLSIHNKKKDSAQYVVHALMPALQCQRLSICNFQKDSAQYISTCLEAQHSRVRSRWVAMALRSTQRAPQQPGLHSETLSCKTIAKITKDFCKLLKSHSSRGYNKLAWKCQLSFSTSGCLFIEDIPLKYRSMNFAKCNSHLNVNSHRAVLLGSPQCLVLFHSNEKS